MEPQKSPSNDWLDTINSIYGTNSSMEDIINKFIDEGSNDANEKEVAPDIEDAEMKEEIEELERETEALKREAKKLENDTISQDKKDRIGNKLTKIWELIQLQNPELVNDAMFVYVHYLLATEDSDYSSLDKTTLEELNTIWKKYK